LTLGRIILACALAALWIIPLGVSIGLNPRLSKTLQPLIQFFNAYPTPLLFPAVIVVLSGLGLPFEFCSIVLMMLSVFAYLLFNVIEGASKISQEARDVWACYGPGRLAYWRKFLLPSILPSLVSGFNTMVMAAWNATIVTEYIRLNGQALVVSHGLGASINLSTEAGDLALLTASVFMMVAVVACLNRILWMPLQDYSARFSE
jgi:NitT/TauT family transport system permease protein